MRRTRFDFAVSIVCLSLLGFFGWHGYYGERSLAKADLIDARAAALAKDRDAIREQRLALEARVRLLRPDSVDPDLVEELARKLLGFAHERDVVLQLGPAQ